jgi:hypothetical protein
MLERHDECWESFGEMWLEPFSSCGASANFGRKSVQRPNLLLACHVAKVPSMQNEHPKFGGAVTSS